ncbi:hypothetical protein [Tateyamaria sp.]|uniref:hypothetical protein n=1 Tax=Tateyamaria sp. TaxID=1929288 RepID=UPI003B215C7E
MERENRPAAIRPASDQDATLSASDTQAQLAAMSQIMQAINASRHDTGPIFDAILENAQRLCNAPMAGLVLATAQDDHQTLAAYVVTCSPEKSGI